MASAVGSVALVRWRRRELGVSVEYDESVEYDVVVAPKEQKIKKNAN